MDNSINFKGIFVVNRPNVVLRQAIKTAGKLNTEQIFPEFSGKNTILYTVQDCFDKNVSNILIGTPNVKFRYYPTLNSKSGFDPKNKSEALNMLAKAKNTAISTKDKLIHVFKKKSRDVLYSNIRRIQERNLKLMEQETLIDLNNKNYRKNIDVQTGICRIFVDVPDRGFGKIKRHTLIEITPPNKSGICFAKYTPVSEEQESRRIAINKNGEKMFEYKDPTSTFFKKNVAEAKENYASKYQDLKLFVS